MFYLTGDIHGNVTRICSFIEKYGLTENDTIIILGDAGLNYFGNSHGDAKKKKKLNRYNVPIFCIHGNHEMRPQTIDSYTESVFHGSAVFVEADYPNLYFAKDGEVYDFDGKKTIVIGGAYSVDKFYRIATGNLWFEDEQPSQETKDYVESRLDSLGWNVDYVLSHTCPDKFTPQEALMPQINQKYVDTSTEIWLDSIEDRLSYKKWYCGHFHINKVMDNIRFMMEDFILLGN